MNYAEVHPNVATFALGGLDPEEAAEIQRHIASCADCQSELEELEKVNRVLDVAPPPAAPPTYLKGEILSRVRAEGRSPSNKAGRSERSSSQQGQSSSHRTSRFNRFKELRLALPSAAAAALVAVI